MEEPTIQSEPQTPVNENQSDNQNNYEQNIDWFKLKTEFMESDIQTVKDFLRSKKMDADKPYYTARTNGWAQEKKAGMQLAYQKAMEKIVEKDENVIIEMKKRQKKLGIYLQSKGLQALKSLSIDKADDARKMINTGVRLEIEASTDTSEKKGGGTPQSLTQVNFNLPSTQLDKLLDGLSYPEILRLIAELRRKRTPEIGESPVVESQPETE